MAQRAIQVTIRKSVLTICLSGPPCSGKTSLALMLTGYLRSKGLAAGYVPEAIRDSLYFSGQIFGPELNFEILGLQLVNEMRSRAQYEILVLDRCLIDLLGYFLLRNKLSDLIYDVGEVTKFIRSYALNYDFCFFRSTLPVFRTDNFREKENLAGDAIADAILQAFQRVDVAYHSTPIEQALPFCIDIIREDVLRRFSVTI